MINSDDSVLKILGQVSYKDWDFVTILDNGYRIHIEFIDHNELQICREWILPSITPSDIVKTAWMAIQAAEEHEMRENFRYRGKRIFSPHFDVDKMAEFSKLENTTYAFEEQMV